MGIGRRNNHPKHKDSSRININQDSKANAAKNETSHTVGKNQPPDIKPGSPPPQTPDHPASTKPKPGKPGKRIFVILSILVVIIVAAIVVRGLLQKHPDPSIIDSGTKTVIFWSDTENKWITTTAVPAITDATYSNTATSSVPGQITITTVTPTTTISATTTVTTPKSSMTDLATSTFTTTQPAPVTIAGTSAATSTQPVMTTITTNQPASTPPPLQFTVTTTVTSYVGGVISSCSPSNTKTTSSSGDTIMWGSFGVVLVGSYVITKTKRRNK
jgi:hypothetical protein